MRRLVRQRLYLQIYLAIVGVLLFTVLAAGGTARLLRPSSIDYKAWHEEHPPPWKQDHDPELWAEWHRAQAMTLAVLFAALAAGSYPLARRITRRLEQLQEGIEAFEGGELSARADVDGQDELAAVAASFNRAAMRVEALVAQERRMLASASHELRSPLARLRLALELLRDEQGASAETLDAMALDIEELDGTVEDLLLAGRLASTHGTNGFADLDLLGLAAEEAARLGLEVAGEPTPLHGHARSWRRLVRNLLENAHKHGGADVSVSVTPAALVVEDRGPGVPPGDEARIFEPFYRPDDHREGADGGVGLGLFLVRQIAEHHGAAVRYEARDGGGSRFVVALSGGPPPGP